MKSPFPGTAALLTAPFTGVFRALTIAEEKAFLRGMLLPILLIVGGLAALLIGTGYANYQELRAAYILTQGVLQPWHQYLLERQPWHLLLYFPLWMLIVLFIAGLRKFAAYFQEKTESFSVLFNVSLVGLLPALIISGLITSLNNLTPVFSVMGRPRASGAITAIALLLILSGWALDGLIHIKALRVKSGMRTRNALLIWLAPILILSPVVPLLILFLLLSGPAP